MTQLRKALSSTAYVANPYSLPSVYSYQQPVGDVLFTKGAPQSPLSAYGSRLAYAPSSYNEELYQSRFFYRNDPVASTVINRMAELAAGTIRNRKSFANDEEFNYYDSLKDRITAVLQQAALEYLVSGMAIIDYGITKTMGNRLHPSLGRKRYSVPERLWCRNPENIKLKRAPFGPERIVYVNIPPEERSFIQNKGVYPDGTEDKELYSLLVREFPEYVKAINDGISSVRLKDVCPIFRKILPNCDYPQPFLVPALSSLKHKLRIKEMDHSIATRALNAILHVKAGNDDFPVTDEDETLNALQEQLSTTNSDAASQLIYKLFTDHTVEIEWIYPQLEALLASNKYESVDGDIYMAMGFSRVLLVGESNKSNAGAGPAIVLGPFAMLEELRWKLIEWVKHLYGRLAELNNFTNWPEPMFDPLVSADVQTLVTQAGAALKSGVISKDTFAQFYGTSFDSEQRQIEHEVDVITASRNIDQQVQLGQQPHTPPPTVPQGQTSPDGTTTSAPETQLPSDTL